MKNIFKNLYFQVLLAIIVGVGLGHWVPDLGVNLKPLGDGFISLIKMLVGPVIFCTIVLGISGAGSLKKAGRVGGKALLYFEVVSTFALGVGLIVGNLLRPGESFHIDPSTLSASAVAEYTEKIHDQGLVQILLHIIPKTFFDAFTGSGDLLQVLLVAVLFAIALNHLGEKRESIRRGLELILQVFFRMVNLVMRLAPIGALGAMAFTVGKYGLASLLPLISLIGTFYLTCGIFIFVILGIVAAITGFNIFRFVHYIRDELLIVLGTSSSESALVPLMEKLENLGCSKAVVGLVVPSGYSFNLDGTNIYLTLAILFISQALGIELSLGQQLSVLAVAMISSKGASGVTGAGFVTLAATLAVVPSVPVAGVALIIGIDKFMSEARALTNIIGNGVATLVISRWEGELNHEKLKQQLSKNPKPLEV